MELRSDKGFTGVPGLSKAVCGFYDGFTANLLINTESVPRFTP